MRVDGRYIVGTGPETGEIQPKDAPPGQKATAKADWRTTPNSPVPRSPFVRLVAPHLEAETPTKALRLACAMRDGALPATQTLAKLAETASRGHGCRVGPDILALAERVLFPALESHALTWRQQREAAELGKAYLLERGRWPLALTPGICRRGHPRPKGGACPGCRSAHEKRRRAGDA